MRVIKIIKQYMGNYLKEKGFKYKRISNDIIEYHYEKNETILIRYTQGGWNKNSVCTEIRRDNCNDDWGSYYLSYFKDDLDLFDSESSDGMWYFYNESELIGLLEKQAEILEAIGLNWLFNEIDIKLDEMISLQSEERERTWDAVTDFETDPGIQEIRAKQQTWKNQRFLPKKWLT